MLIPNLIEQNKHLPESSYYLDVADFLVEEANKRFADKPIKQIRINTLEKIQEMFEYSFDLFENDKKEYKTGQKQRYLERKIRYCERQKELQKKHIKMIIAESEKTDSKV